MSKLSIIVPVYWNEDTLEDLYNDLKNKVLEEIESYEIVFVNDGSGDNSWKVIKKLQSLDKNIVAVNLSKNFGEHSAILAGLSVCSGDCAVTKQADCQEDSALILDMYQSWKNGKKVVLAARASRKDSFFTKLFANIYYGLIHNFVNQQMPQGGCDCFLVDRQAINTILSLKEINSSLILQVLWIGYDCDVIYFNRQERKKGNGKWTFSKKFKLILDSFIGFSYIPIRIMWLTGILFCIFAIIMSIEILIEYFATGIPVAGWASLMIVLLLATGLILIMLGLLGEYTWRIFDEVRNRPPYIIEKICINEED